MAGAAPRDLLEICELDLEGDCAAAETGALAVLPHLIDDLSKHITCRFVGEEIGGKRVLGADGFACPVGPDGPLVDAARGPVIVRARLPEMVLQEALCLALEIEPVSIPSRAIFLAVAGPMP